MTHVIAFRTQLPADGPPWLLNYDRSVVELFRRMMPAPFMLHGYATADLPTASEHTHSLVFDHDVGTVKFSDGANWLSYSLSTHTHTASEITDFAEAVDDRVNAFLVEGTGIDLTYNDGANTLTIATTITQYTDELAQDAVGTILTDTATIDFTYNDSTPSITADVKDGSVTYGKMQDVSATDKLLGRSTAGSGDVEEIACTAAGRSMVAAADAQAQRVLLRNAAMAKLSANLTGTNFTAGVTISWDGTDPYDDGAWHDPSGAPTIFTVPAGVTRLRVGCTICMANVAASAPTTVSILKNGGSSYDGNIQLTVMTSTTGPRINCGGMVPVAPGDTFAVNVFVNDSSADITAATSNFWIEAC